MGKQGRRNSQRKKADEPTVPLSPVIIDKAAAQQRYDEAERVGIFEVEGVTYSVPLVERAELGLEYMAQLDKKGEELAAWWLINEGMGKDAVKALRSVKGLGTVELDSIMTRLRAIITPAARKRPKAAR